MAKKSDRERLEKVDFYEACKSIKEVRGWPGDRSDAEYAQEVRVRDLLSRMLTEGFEKKGARQLIAESSETPEYLVRAWTKYVARNSSG